MNDYAKTLEAKSDQINNSDLIGRTQTIKITGVRTNTKEDQPVSISFEGSDKVFRPCKGMRALLADIWGLETQTWTGRLLTLYRDPDVKFGADTTGGMRISEASHITGERKITVKVRRGVNKTYTVRPLRVSEGGTVEPPIEVDAPAAQAEARTAAKKGKDNFTRWWQSNIPKRDAVHPIMDEIRKLTAAADAAAAGGVDNDDPLGNPGGGRDDDDPVVDNDDNVDV